MVLSVHIKNNFQQTFFLFRNDLFKFEIMHKLILAILALLCASCLAIGKWLLKLYIIFAYYNLFSFNSIDNLDGVIEKNLKLRDIFGMSHGTIINNNNNNFIHNGRNGVLINNNNMDADVFFGNGISINNINPSNSFTLTNNNINRPGQTIINNVDLNSNGGSFALTNNNIGNNGNNVVINNAWTRAIVYVDSTGKRIQIGYRVINNNKIVSTFIEPIYKDLAKSLNL